MNVTNTIRLSCALLSILFSAACRYEPLSDSAPPLTQLAVRQGEISNWKPEEEMKVFVGDELFNFNNGGAVPYINKGCIKTGVQQLIGPDDGQSRIMIMDFGNAENAFSMWSEMELQSIGNTVPDLKFPDTTICITPILGGVTGYVRFSNYYLEVNVAGFSDQILAVQTLDLILGLLQKKISP